MNSSAKTKHAVAPSSNIATDELMMSEEDSTSRDSGICEMEEGSPTCFSSMSSTTYDAMEVEETSENAAPSAENRASKSSTTTIRREKSSCQVRLFDESPVSHTKFVRPAFNQRPSGLAVRSANLHRKRSRQEDDWGAPAKMDRPSDHYHLEGMSIDETERELDDMLKSVQQSRNVTSRALVVTATGFQRSQSTATCLLQDDFAQEEADSEHLVVHYSLETIGKVCSTSFRRITAETLRNLMTFDQQFESKYLLVDCRYPFEFMAGHIKSAVNFYDRDNVSDLFYDKSGKPRFDKKILIFYCEFSQKRGPSMAYALRRDDRLRNMRSYPNCDYKEMYVLDRGYRNFHAFAGQNELSLLCQPEAEYVEMVDKRYSNELKKFNYHRRGAPGQSVMRMESAPGFTRSSSSDSSIQTTSSYCSQSSTSTSEIASTSVTVQAASASNEHSSRTTPAVQRVASARRHLFADATCSPTSFGRPAPRCSAQTPSPHKMPVRPPQFS